MNVQEPPSGVSSKESLWLNLLGSETRYYDAAGVPTRSIEAGTGFPLILLHGIGGHAETYARNVVPLGAHFHVYAIDFLGHGLTGGIDGPITHVEYVKHLIDFMDAAGIERAHIGGESLGGWIAVWTALLHPERVADVIYIVGAKLKVPGVDEEAKRKTAAGRDELQRLSQQLRANPSRENVKKRMTWLFHKPERDLGDELVDLRWKLYQRAASAVKPVSGQRVAGPTVQDLDDGALTPELLGKLKNRTLVLWTDHNPSQVLAVAEKAMNYLPNAELIVMKDCGHWPQWEDLETFNRIVIDFLTRGK
jgi:2-hydroxy-6-oxonona-2,4-dienedioate hydrolase